MEKPHQQMSHFWFNPWKIPRLCDSELPNFLLSLDEPKPLLQVHPGHGIHWEFDHDFLGNEKKHKISSISMNFPWIHWNWTSETYMFQFHFFAWFQFSIFFQDVNIRANGNQPSSRGNSWQMAVSLSFFFSSLGRLQVRTPICSHTLQ